MAALGSNGKELFGAVLWDLESWSEIRTIEAQPGFIRFLDISPDGKKLVTDDYAEAIAQVWDIESGELLQTFSGHTGFTYAVAFTPDSQSIVTTADDATLRLWTLEYGAVIRRFPHADQVKDVAYDPSDSRYALSLEPGALHLWNLESENPCMVAASQPVFCSIRPDEDDAR
jgi:WD40 repeat protein